MCQSDLSPDGGAFGPVFRRTLATPWPQALWPLDGASVPVARLERRNGRTICLGELGGGTVQEIENRPGDGSSQELLVGRILQLPGVLRMG
jgi:hypothetical protein